MNIPAHTLMCTYTLGNTHIHIVGKYQNNRNITGNNSSKPPTTLLKPKSHDFDIVPAIASYCIADLQLMDWNLRSPLEMRAQ